LYLARRRTIKSEFLKRLEAVKKCQKGTNQARHFAWVNRENIWEKKRYLQERVRIMRLKDKNKELIKFLEIEGAFPILDLPDELISNIFSILPIKDRLRARVNKRLDEIELESKYELGELHIKEQSMDDTFESTFGSETQIIFFEEQSYSSECIKRIARNASIKKFHIRLTGSGDFHREVYNLIKEF
ncbi:hypothetical protein PMAYCL1PPCAC_20412, partial [Pristionchus mayeri]